MMQSIKESKYLKMLELTKVKVYRNVKDKIKTK